MQIPPRNPYIAGKALDDSRGFFGRDDVFHVVETVLSSPDQNSVVLFGQRRIGKTSILLNLRSRLCCPPFVPVYFDLMERARKSLATVSFELAATVAQALHLPQPARADFDDEGCGFRQKFLPQVYSALGNSRLVLLFDEFDVLNVGAEEQLGPTSAAIAFFPYLRDMMTNEQRLGFVFVVGRKMEQLSIEFTSAFKASRSLRISTLDDEAADALVRNAERDGLLRFSDAAVTRVLNLTARHPYFTQLTCQLLFERAYSRKPPGIDITAGDVDAIVPKVLEAGDAQFEWIWDGLPPAERVIFSVIASGSDEQTIITEERLLTTLLNQGVRILIRELQLAPVTLVDWEMLKEIDGGYKFFIELLRRWVMIRKPASKVRDELDRVAPLADTLYQGANGFYRRGDLERATTQLQTALNINPNHFKARLLLGETYRMQGKLDDAVSELEEAFRIDEQGGRISLEMLLLQRAGTLERENLIDRALQDYTRVLMISPRNLVAKQRYAAIWVQLGEAALRANAFKDALAAFRAANDEQRAVKAEALARNFELRRVVELVKMKLELGIERRYDEALQSMRHAHWTQGQRALADVIFFKPDHPQASDMLAALNLLLKGKDTVTVSLPNPIELPDQITVRELAARLKVSPIDVIRKLMSNGIMANINMPIDYETAALVALQLGFEPFELAEEKIGRPVKIIMTQKKQALD